MTNAPTFRENEKFSAYAPYVKEMDIWFNNVEEIGIISPGSYPDSVFTQEFNIQRIKLFKLPFINFSTFYASIFSILLSPVIFFQFLRSFIWTDHIHLRCPGNFGLIGCFVQILFPGKPKTAKYAGNWDPEAKQPWSYRLQKWILSNTFLTRNMTVLVYGNWQDQSKNLLPFFTASFSESEIEKIQKEFNPPYKFLFVGNLTPGKRPLFAVQLVETLIKKSIPAELHFYGNGECMDELKHETKNKSYIDLQGNQQLDSLKKAYKDCHFLILASKSEGWPKAVAEAMFFGCIPIATAVSCVPYMLKSPPAPEGGAKTVTITERGILIPPIFRGGDEETHWIAETGNVIQELLKNPEKMKRISQEAQLWSQQYTLERFESEIKKLLAPLPITIGTKKPEQKGEL